MKEISLTADEQKLLSPWLAELAGIQRGLQMAQQILIEQMLKNRGANNNGDESSKPQENG